MISNLIEEWVLESPLMKILGERYDHSITISTGDIEIDNQDTGYTLEIFVESGTSDLIAYTKKANHWFDGLGQWQTDWIDTEKIDLRSYLNAVEYEELRGLLKTYMAAQILKGAMTCKN